MPALLAQLERHEGYRRAVYNDSLGYATIGIGRLVDGRKGGGITKEEARYLLVHDVDQVVGELTQRLPWWTTLSEIRQRVLVDMAFNLGIAGLLSFKNTLKAIHDGDWAAAEFGMLNSKWATQVKQRAHTLAYMMRHDEEPAI